jgi:hypothetical protein
MDISPWPRTSTLRMEAARSSETLVSNHHTTSRTTHRTRTSIYTAMKTSYDTLLKLSWFERGHLKEVDTSEHFNYTKHFPVCFSIKESGGKSR